MGKKPLRQEPRLGGADPETARLTAGPPGWTPGTRLLCAGVPKGAQGAGPAGRGRRPRSGPGRSRCWGRRRERASVRLGLRNKPCSVGTCGGDPLPRLLSTVPAGGGGGARRQIHPPPTRRAQADSRDPGDGSGTRRQARPGAGRGQPGRRGHSFLRDAEPHLGFPALQPLVKEDIVGAEGVGGEGIFPDCGVWGLVQVGQVLQGALAEALQSCKGPAAQSSCSQQLHTLATLPPPETPTPAHKTPSEHPDQAWDDRTGGVKGPQNSCTWQNLTT